MLGLRIAAVVTGLIALGFAAPVPWVASHLLREGKLPTFMGMFPMYGGPLSARCSPPVFVLLLGAFLMLCAAEGFAAYLVWNGHRLGAHLMLALLVPGAACWAGFALPIPAIAAVVRIAALVLGWSALR